MKVARAFNSALLTVISLVLVGSSTLLAQQPITAVRPDGKTTPMLLYPAVHPTSACAPLAIISHGAGGSENGYRYLAQAMSQAGFTTIVMGHRESGMRVLTSDMATQGIKAGVQSLVADPQAEQDRLLDTTAALAVATRQCQPPFRVLIGHSMGSETVMLEAGALNLLNIASPPAAQNRFDAYVALSPEGPGIVFPEHAWADIHKPVLVLTGTRDQSLKGGPIARQTPWRELPGDRTNCQWMGVITGATHMNFAGIGIGSDRVEPLVTQTIQSFLTGVRKGACVLPLSSPEMALQSK